VDLLTQGSVVESNGKNCGKWRQNASGCGSGFEIKSASMNLSLRRYSPDARLHERQRLDYEVQWKGKPG
jgi:hypothetical protein